MGKETIRRPEAGSVKAMLDQAARMDAGLAQLRDSGPSWKKAAREAAARLYEDRIQKTLEQMDVEHINNGKQGLRVGLLSSIGVENVWQASRLSYRQICDIDGLGELSARKILQILEKIRENTEQTIRIRIRAEGEDEAEADLIRALYLWIHGIPLAQQAGELYRQHHGPLQKEAALAKQAVSGFCWMFKSRGKKEQILQAVEQLRCRLEGPLGGENPVTVWDRIAGADMEACRADYRSCAPVYYARLEQLGLNWGQQETSGGLPAQLARQIEAEELDLKYLRATLRSYQTFGTKYIVHQKKSLLGDEMGLGKTVQAIAAMAALAARGKSHFMVVCPAGVLINWCREIPRFSTLEVTKVHGNDEEALLHWRENGGVAVTTYESISRFVLPERFPISMVVADEAHYVKNPETLRTKALLKLLAKTEHILFMSGTPLENRVEEMCFLIRCLQPQIADALEEVKFLSTAEQFRQQLAPVYLRRTREDVLQELPDLIEKEQWCELGQAERADYRDAVLSENFMTMRQVSWQTEDLGHSAKAARLLELWEQAKEQKRKIIVFSFFRTTLEKVAQLLGDRCLEPITGAVSPQRRQEIVDEFTKAGDGAVLVSQVQAGGTGLNIQSASVIIFCEPQIKPSIEHQAVARAYRMGQVRDVLVYRLLAEDTVDEKIREMLKTKQVQFDSFADESVVGEESLKQEENWIRNMVEEEKKRVLEEKNP